ncbi:MAG: DTW domain-containing protein [Proteobacteria bacterium]|jgi:DTW domain-containing protein YfiP|nr:DTW domain-containing protein [Pseudomonadota bacterium]
MKLEQYLSNKKTAQSQTPQRIRCVRCLQPTAWCYCSLIQPFDSGIKFVILLHPLERRRRIATGRMSHLLLQNSLLIQGYKYTNDPKIDALIADPQYHCVLLCLGDNAKNLDVLSPEEKKDLCPDGKKLLVFVVDGTWGTASKTVRLSENLNQLPRICFSPVTPSMFRVRQQPQKNCYSTIEAIHRTIDLLGDSQGMDMQARIHDRLLSVFDAFVSKQVQYLKDLKERTGSLQYRRTYRK